MEVGPWSNTNTCTYYAITITVLICPTTCVVCTPNLRSYNLLGFIPFEMYKDPPAVRVIPRRRRHNSHTAAATARSAHLDPLSRTAPLGHSSNWITNWPNGSAESATDFALGLSRQNITLNSNVFRFRVNVLSMIDTESALRKPY